MKIRRLRRAFGLALVLVAAAAPAASSAQSASTVGEREAFRAQVENAGRLIIDGKPKAALTSIDALLPRASDMPVKSALLRLKMIAFLADSREPEAIAVLNEASGLDPSGGTAITAVELGGDMGASALAVRALRLIVETHPDALPGLKTEHVWTPLKWLADTEGKAASDTLILALAEHDIAASRPDAQAWFLRRGVEAAIDRDDTATAASLAGRIDFREPLTRLLVDRRYAQLWPSIEASVGVRMSLAGERAIAAGERAVDADATGTTARHAWFTAYRSAARLEQADRVADPLKLDAGSEENDGWLANDHAIVLYALGRVSDADARMAAITALPIAEKPWLINMVINRATFLIEAGEWTAAEAPLGQAERDVVRYGSPYARQIVRAMRLCLTTRGGTAAAAGIDQIAELEKHEADGRESTVDGLLCAGKADAAAAVALRWLDDPDQRGDALMAFQPEGARLPHGPAIHRALYRALSARADVGAALARHGRTLPEALWWKQAS